MGSRIPCGLPGCTLPVPEDINRMAALPDWQPGDPVFHHRCLPAAVKLGVLKRQEPAELPDWLQ